MKTDTFNFRGFSLRTVLIDDKPWFVAADACKAIDLAWDKTNNVYAPSRVTRHLNEDERDSRQIANQGQRLLVVSESGLYKLIMRSDKPQAKEFQTWVTRDVLPAIRMDGGYVEGIGAMAVAAMAECNKMFVPTWGR